jgi:hypothetical protein
MKTLRAAIQSADFQAASRQIAVRLPAVDINESFEDGFIILTAIVQCTELNHLSRIERQFSQLGIRLTDHFLEKNFRMLVVNANRYFMHQTLEFLLGVPSIDVNRRDKEGQMLLIELAKRGHLFPFALFVLSGIDWNVHEPETLDTPLIIMAR